MRVAHMNISSTSWSETGNQVKNVTQITFFFLHQCLVNNLQVTLAN